MSLLIAGDICPTRDSLETFLSGDPARIFGSAASLMQKASVTVANLECALTEADTPIRKIGPNLRAPVAVAETLRRAGVDICSLANNHVLDYGGQGLSDTLHALEQSGLRYTGVGRNADDARRPLFFECDGKRIGLISVAEHEYSYALADKAGVWGFDPFETLFDVAEAKKHCDRLILLYHGGKEQCEYPSPRLRSAARALARAGADVVLCQHSHCIGCHEEYENSYLLYGQGNFHFVYSDERDPQWFAGLLLEIEFAEKPIVTYHPVRVIGAGITLAEGEDKEAILASLASRSRILADPKALWEAWEGYCRGVKEQYRRVPAEVAVDGNASDPADEMLAHYLDCEAHTDVLRTLFRTRHMRGTEE